MDRRTFLISAAASTLAAPALAGSGETYTPGLVAKKLAKGETVFVDFYMQHWIDQNELRNLDFIVQQQRKQVQPDTHFLHRRHLFVLGARGV